MTHNSPAHETLWKLIKDIRFAMLTHRTSSGMLHAHPLTTQNRKVDEKGELYFFIPQSGELYERLLTDGEVNVSYADPGADSYVSLSGQARFSDDMALKEALRVRHAEYWDVDEAKITQLFKMAKAVVSGEPPRSLGEHKELAMP